MWKAPMMTLFLTLPYQVLLKIIVSSTLKIHLDSDYIPSPPLSPIITCLAFHMVSLTASLIFSQGEAFGTSVNLGQSSSQNILMVFCHSQEAKIKQWSQRPDVSDYFLPLRPWVKPHYSPLGPPCSTLLLHIFAFGWLGHKCLCSRAFALAPALVQNASPHMAHIFHFIQVFSNVSFPERSPLITAQKKQSSLSCHSPSPFVFHLNAFCHSLCY